MKYYIIKDGSLQLVSEAEYENWHTRHVHDYLHPDRKFIIGDHIHHIESRFIGAIDKGQGPYPFIVLHFDDQLIQEDDGIKQVFFDEDTQYYASSESYTIAYNNLARRLQEAADKANSG